MTRFKLELDYKPTTSNKTFKHFITPKSMYVLKITKQLSTVEYTVIEAILDHYSMPEGNTTKSYAYSTLSNFLKIDKSNFKKIMDSLFDKGYLIKKDNSIILQIELIISQIKIYMEEHGNKTLNDNTKAEKDKIISEKDKIILKKLEKLIAVGAADEYDLKEYEELKALLHGSTAMNEDNTKETTKEAVLEVKEETEHKDTTSTLEAEKPAKTEQKEIIKEDTSNDTEVDNNKEDENKLQMETDLTIKLQNDLLELDKSNKSIEEKRINIKFKIKSWITSNRKDYSNPYYLQVGLNKYLQEEINNIIENNEIYNSLPEATEEEKTILNGETEIENAVDKYAKALEILHSKYVSDKVSKEYITKEFDDFFSFMDKTQANIIEVYKKLKYKFEKDMVKVIPAPEEQKEADLSDVKEVQVKDTPVAPEEQKTALNGLEKYKNLFEAARMEALKTEGNNEEVTSFFDNII